MRAPATSRRLVVDTNVARSASESQHPLSDACRQVLETIQAEQHRVVLSATQYMEWQKHQSGFSKKWLLQMISKKLHVLLSPEPNSGLTDRIFKLDCTEKAQKEMLKDVHLLENALATDDAVISQETNVFNLFCTHADELKIPRPVAWVHPVDGAPACVVWVQGGAVVAKARCIPAGK
jgi:predicted nucleic acid-binding protein